MLIDTHCHLDFAQFDADREAVLARARSAGVTDVIVPGIDRATSAAAVALAAQAGVWAAVGVHPNSAGEWDATAAGDFAALAGSPGVVAIGEIGLDYYWDKTPPGVQAQVFRAQLNLAAALRLPVIIHCREAMADTLAQVAAWRAAHLEYTQDSAYAHRLGVFHSYSGSVSEVAAVIAMGFYAGVTGPVTYKKADTLREVVRTAPLERLVVETDAPFLTPQPWRGQRNEPGYVRVVAEAVAAVRGEDFDLVAAATTKNAVELFRLENTTTGGKK